MKHLKKLNAFLIAINIISGIVFIVLHCINGEQFPKLVSYFITIFLPFIPIILRKFFHLPISDLLETAFLTFLIPAMVVGIDADLYKCPWSYDKLVHCASGALTAFVAKEILDHCYKKDRNLLFIYLFYIAFTALIAVAWEIFEFSYDQICGGTMQTLISEGVADTMWDLISAFAGGAVAGFFIMFFGAFDRKA